MGARGTRAARALLRPPGRVHPGRAPAPEIRARDARLTHRPWPAAAAAPGSGRAEPLRPRASSPRLGSAAAAGSSPGGRRPRRLPQISRASRAPLRLPALQARPRAEPIPAEPSRVPLALRPSRGRAGPGRTAGSHGKRWARPGPAGLRAVCARREGPSGSARRGGRG